MAFGEEIATNVGGRTSTNKYGQTDSVRQRFTGYQKDDETGLDFAEARYYDDAHGRFTAVDPLLASGKSVNPQTFNRYVYSMNRPLLLTDPTGMQAGNKIIVVGVKVSQPTITPYKVTGNTSQEAWDDAKIKGPQTHDGNYEGKYKGSIGVIVVDAPGKYTPVRNKKNEIVGYKATVTIKSVEITVTGKISVPTAQITNEAEQQKFNESAEKLTSHEKDHHQIEVDGANNIAKPAIENIDQPTGEETGKTSQDALDNAAKNAFNKFIQPVIDTITRQVQNNQTDLDNETGNGTKPRKRTP
jgi:RHS repeat-associated protein